MTYNYDNSTTSTTKGLLLSVSVGSFYSESYSYDSLNRPASVTDTLDSRAYTMHFQYNQANQPTQLTYPDNRVLPYVYDSVGRLSSIGGSSGNPTGYLGNIGYSVADQVTGFSLGNGVQEAFSYDQNRLLLTSNIASKGSTNLMNLSFSYAAQAGEMGTGTTAGNTAELVGVSGTINGQTESASYNDDLNGRLTAFSQTSNGQNAGRAYSWDRWGNRVSETDTIANAQIQSITLQQSGGAPTNRISSVSTNGSPVSYQYDNAGNVTSDGVNTYTYDAQDRLAAVNGGATAQYAYDFRSCRVKKTVAGGLTHYVWLAGHVLAEFDGNSGSDLADYILHGSAYVAKVTAAGTVYMLRDWANTRLELDSNGAVVGAMGTTAFGEDFAESGQQEKYHFTNYERDQETGLDYALNRTYSQTLGRFEQSDPYRASGYLVDPQSWNRYSYARGNPVGRVDADGLDDHNGSWSGGGSSGPWDCTNCSVTIGAGPNALVGSGAGGAGESNALPEENAGGAGGGGNQVQVNHYAGVDAAFKGFFEQNPHCKSAIDSALSPRKGITDWFNSTNFYYYGDYAGSALLSLNIETSQEPGMALPSG
ncbi:MAG: RHS repeat-associated core domain-containing protein, partial [Blastocatellia bacterium]